MTPRYRLLPVLLLTALVPACFCAWRFGATLGDLLAVNLKP